MITSHSALDISNSTIPDLFLRRVKQTPSSPAFHYFNDQSALWQILSWADIGARVTQWTAALSAENLKPGDRVALMLPNGINWVCFDLASLLLGLVVVPLYANDRPENVAYILEHTESKLILLEDIGIWEDIQKNGSHTLESIERVVIPGPLQSENKRSISLESWLERSDIKPDYPVITPDELATIVYTSGTTGKPKGVMLSHSNILKNAASGLASINVYSDDVLLSFLPLSHMLERTVGYYLPMIVGASIGYARSIQHLSDDLVRMKPTILVAVPKIFERVHNKLMVQISKRSPLAIKLFELAAKTGWQHYQWKQGRVRWSPELLLQPLLNRLVGRKIQQKMGGNLRIVISGGAPLSFKIASVLIGLGIPIFQGYGLTEASPIISVNRVESNQPDTVGPPLPGVEVKRDDTGELLVRGANVMKGYWRNPEATAETIDSEGWLHTGDVAELRDNHLLITGRVKDILVLSNSEKISPTDMETAIGSDPLFEQTMIVGEGRPYLTLLAVLNDEMWQQLAARLEVPSEDASLANERVRAEIMKRVEECLRTFPGYAWVKNVSLSLNPWTIERGLLTPTLKIKRKHILSAMADEIERMYQT